MQAGKAFLVLVLVAIAVISVYFLNDKFGNDRQENEGMFGYKNTEYVIEGRRVKLEDGFAEVEAAPGSVSLITTRYFGNELKTDLNDDGQEDVVFLLTEESGGSGTFYYVVAALNTDRGYVGSDGYLLGDRIAPQTTELSQNPRHRNVVVVNYADRIEGEPMSAKPTVGKSAYLKLDVESLTWGIVEPDFEGESIWPETVAESWGTIMGTVMLGPTCPVVMDPPDESCADRPYETDLALTTGDQSIVLREMRSNKEGKFQIDVPAGTYAIRSAAAANILPYCQLEPFMVPINDTVEIVINCDSGIR